MQQLQKYSVIHNLLQSEIGAIQVGSAEWFAWLSENCKFTFHGEGGHFMAQSEIRSGKPYWYAYRRREGRLSKVYLGKSEELTLTRLEQAGRALAGQNAPASASAALFTSAGRIDSSILPVTKINTPILPRQMVARPRLTQKINTPLTLIIAPSGFGKSTLLNEWKQSSDFPVAWLSLDEHDNSLYNFWNSIVLAIRPIWPELGMEFLANLNTAQALFNQEAVLRLSQDLTRAAPQRLGVILDDFQHINSNEIFDALQFWLDHLPPNLQLVISSQIRPPLSLGHLRARGKLTELDANHLRFTLEEGIQFLRNYPLEPPLEFEDLNRLANHNEGWAAGLTLTALALSNQVDRRQFIDTFSGGHIFFREFFLETVLHHLSPTVQAFLLKTSILKHLTGSLCDALTGQADGAQILARLRGENIFIVQLEQQGWYRYHNLFAEMLFSQLNARNSEDIPLLHKRAAQWFREHYAPADAINHLLATEAWEEAATLMEEMALQELEQFGEDSRLLRWLQELPASVVQKHKTLLFVYLRLAAISFPRERVERFMAQIKANLNALPAAALSADEGEVLAEIQRLEQSRARNDPLEPRQGPGGVSDSRWDLLNQLQIVNMNYYPNTPETERRIADLVQRAQAQKNLYVTMLAGGVWAERTYMNGQLRRCKKIAQQLLDFATARRGALPETASIALAALCHVYLEQNDLGMAQTMLTQILEVDPNPTSTNMSVLLGFLRAKIQISQGRPEMARSIIHSLRELHLRRPSSVWSSHDLIAFEAIACVRTGDLAAAEQLLNVANDVSSHFMSQLALAEMYLAKNQPGEAEKRLNRLILKYPLGMRLEPLMYARVPLALALFQQKNFQQARQVMQEALRLAVPEKLFRPFLLRGAELIPLLLLTLRTHNLNAEGQAFAQTLLKWLGCDEQQLQGAQEEVDVLSINASISPREQEVLRSISAGCSNREVAETLSISESTVKTHLSNLYAKLDVTNRLQAITRARQLKLI